MDLSHLEELNERQREAVAADDGPTLVLAGAGSGKTRVIAHRIAHLISALKLPADTILAVTFTNKAAAEMRGRVKVLLSSGSAGLAVHTFHALCLRLLRAFGEDAGLPDGFTLYGESDRRSLLRRLAREQNLAERELPISRLSAAVSAIKNEAHALREGGFLHPAIPVLAARYQQELAGSGAVDFDDLLLRGVELLETSERAKSYALRRFQQVLVDEYQDTNRIQYRLLRLLAPHGNLFVVGDEDQSIYNFRGADLRNILDFERDFPNARIVKLEVNYRSTAAILRAASGVIRNNRERKGKILVSVAGEGEPIVLREALDEREEARAAAESIARLRSDRPSARIAVLLRTHAQTRVFEEELVLKNVPHQVVGGLRFYERREIQDALAYLRLLVNRSDDRAFLRAVNVPSRGVGPASLALLELRAKEGRLSLWDASLELLSGEGISGRARLGLASFRDLVERLSSGSASARPSAALSAVLKDTGLLASLDSEGDSQARERRENLDQLVASAVEYEQPGGDEASLAGFLDGASLTTDAEGLDDRTPCLLMTIHGAKGLEFDAVFLAGLEEGLFPHVRSLGSRSALEEERRLFYVGLTRARSRLFLSYALSRRASYQASSRSPSRFLDEIPADALAPGARLVRPATGRALQGDFPRSSGRLRPGVRVLHQTFGEGRVVDASGSGPGQKVTVIFAKAGRKRLVAQHAHLEVLS